MSCTKVIKNSDYMSSAFCHITNGCVKKFFCTPLELTYPNIYGKLDREQKILIKEGAMTVVLLENASDIVRQVKDYGTFLEDIFAYILADNKSKYAFLGSYTFPDLEDGEEPVLKMVKEVKKKVKEKKTKYILHTAIELGGVGHYGVIIRNGKTVIVFDSMQHGGSSHYTPTFMFIAQKLFGIEPITPRLPEFVHECLQPTGGFVYPREKGESQKSWLARVQNMDSQNHFCYMWAIWWAHLFITGGIKAPDNAVKYIRQKCIHPLVVIKKYIWSILHMLFPTRKKLSTLFRKAIKNDTEINVGAKDATFITNFFIMNFRNVWDDLNTNDPTKFSRYTVIDCDLSVVRKFNNINQCLKYSLSDVVYVIDNFCTIKNEKSKQKSPKKKTKYPKLRRSARINMQNL